MVGGTVVGNAEEKGVEVVLEIIHLILGLGLDQHLDHLQILHVPGRALGLYQNLPFLLTLLGLRLTLLHSAILPLLILRLHLPLDKLLLMDTQRLNLRHLPSPPLFQPPPLTKHNPLSPLPPLVPLLQSLSQTLSPLPLRHLPLLPPHKIC